MMMVSRIVPAIMFCAFVVCKIHSFWYHWHRHSMTWHAAHTLLESDVCTHTYLRISIREFNNCESAETSVAEEMHICGQGRCAVLYMDITDRLVYIVPLSLALCLLLLLKFGRDYRYEKAREEYSQFALPQSKAFEFKSKLKEHLL